MTIISKFNLTEFANEVEKNLDENKNVASILGQKCKLNLIIRLEEDDMYSLHLDIESEAEDLDEDDAESIADMITENFSELVSNSLDDDDSDHVQSQHTGTSVALNGSQIY